MVDPRYIIFDKYVIIEPPERAEPGFVPFPSLRQCLWLMLGTLDLSSRGPLVQPCMNREERRIQISLRVEVAETGDRESGAGVCFLVTVPQEASECSATRVCLLPASGESGRPGNRLGTGNRGTLGRWLLIRIS